MYPAINYTPAQRTARNKLRFAAVFLAVASAFVTKTLFRAMAPLPEGADTKTLFALVTEKPNEAPQTPAARSEEEAQAFKSAVKAVNKRTDEATEAMLFGGPHEQQLPRKVAVVAVIDSRVFGQDVGQSESATVEKRGEKPKPAVKPEAPATPATSVPNPDLRDRIALSTSEDELRAIREEAHHRGDIENEIAAMSKLYSVLSSVHDARLAEIQEKVRLTILGQNSTKKEEIDHELLALKQSKAVLDRLHQELSELRAAKIQH